VQGQAQGQSGPACRKWRTRQGVFASSWNEDLCKEQGQGSGCSLRIASCASKGNAILARHQLTGLKDFAVTQPAG
jgi:hypothetical protein